MAVEDHRQSVATGMCEALFVAFPDVRWYNSALSENSGPLFQSIHAKHPERRYPVIATPNGRYPVSVRVG
ncbi:hypothetical protein C3B61_15290 [Cryobacterium zongtaii]|uniref:Uncharacterized protein n=1 Tax=Cryobacterium zongtaii TaxID=1259217 RepID=A0A2S3ZBL8_9MICO|nr:hypothetical protein B7495_18330 [Cryobacterium sp. LW097]POH63033.1 hypothetical protein C3B61_15290 [Cryobacterium zongtaii]